MLRIRAFVWVVFLLCFSYQGFSQTEPNTRPQAELQENCGNGKDDDNDGLIDCADTDDCSSIPRCHDESLNCGDGIDNDGVDGIDCADPKCDCTQAEICNNFIDDDGDGLIDCADTVGVTPNGAISNCINSVSCERECNNGVDDDGDGFFDYYDGDCQDNPDNPNDYLIIKPDCEARPEDNVFDVNEAWRSADRTASSRGIPIIADVDNDGTPEVISNNEDNRIVILSGINGVIEREVTFTSNKSGNGYNNSHLAVGEVDNDGYGEIFHLEQNGWIRAYDHTLGIPFWKVRSTMRAKRPPLLADFNRDGDVELYFGNEIRDAATGAEIVRGSHGSNTYGSDGNNWSTELNGYPVAIDILPDSECTTCDGLELVLGHIIYAVDIPGGKLTVAKTMDDVATKVNYTGDYFPKDPRWGGQNYSSTAVVDFNGDGNLDILMSGATGGSRGPSTVFLWDLANDRAKAYVVSRPATEFALAGSIIGSYEDLNGNPCGGTDECTWVRGIGSLNVADIDNDQELECTFMSGSSLYAIDNNMETEWANHEDFWESSSGVTGTAVFDFDGDGASEVIYRDQVDLYIVDGYTGQILNGQYANLTKCSSQTTDEYPVVADVDGDGETEVVVTCGIGENERYKTNTSTGGQENKKSHIRAYKASPGTFWVPARKIWNQYTYFNVNVNDNMTIPRYQQPHHLNFSQVCNDPSAPNKFSLNKFLNQSPRITFCGDLAFPAAKLNFGDSVDIINPICPEEEFEVTLSFKNTGDYPVTQPIPFAFYAQDPMQSYSNTDDNPWLDTLWIEVPGGLAKGQSKDTTVMVRGARGQFDLFISMNDVGPFDRDTRNPIANASFYPLKTLNGTVRECDGNPTVVSRTVDPTAFKLNVRTKDNQRCSADENDPLIINNGQIILTDSLGNALNPLSDGSEGSNGYVISLINAQTGDPVDISASVANLDSVTAIQNLDSGTYVLDVRYQNASFSCGSVKDTITLTRIDTWPEDVKLTIFKDQDVTSCQQNTADGKAHVLINDTVPASHYIIEWRNEQFPDEVFVGHTVTNLRAITYDIFVTNRETGCELNDSTLRMNLDRPTLNDPVVQHITDCKTPPNGSITAKLQGKESIADFEYLLLPISPQGDPIGNDQAILNLNDTTVTFENLSAGIYEIKAIDPTNQCGSFSTGLTAEVEDQSAAPGVTISQVSPQTACDPTKANGHLRATPVETGTYTYTWYKGTVTTGPTVGSTADATGLYTYGNPTQTFTVVMVNTATECVTIESFDLAEALTIPEIDPADVKVKPRTSCDTPNGQISATVGGDTVGYVFRLYEGFTTSGTFVGEETSGIFTGLDAIDHTVQAVEKATGCFATGSSFTETVTVPDGTLDPATVLDVMPVNQSSCDSDNPNGQITANITGGSASDYHFEWKKNVGGILTDITTAEPTAVVNGNQVTNIRKGNYQVKITADSSGCFTTQSVVLDDDIISGDDILVALNPTAATKCDPADGSITVTQVSYTQDGGATYTVDNMANYSFRWYEGADTTFRVDETEYPSATSSNLVNVPPGQYTVVATNRLSTCAAIAYTGTVDGPAPLELSFAATTHGSTGAAAPCINPDGSLTVNILAGSGSYAYQWYKGEGTSVPIPGATSATLNGIRADRYTVEVTDLFTNCITDSTFTLGADDNLLPAPASALKDYAPSTSCDPNNYNGILEAQVDPAIKAASYSGHTEGDFFYYWFEGDQVKYKDPLVNTTYLDDPANYDVFEGTMPTATDNRARLENLAAGEYTVVVLDVKDYLAGGATNINQIGCRAIDTTFVVEAIAQKPQVDDPVVSDNTSCAGNGSVVVTVAKKATDSTFPAVPEAYLFEWTDNQGNTLTATQSNNGTVSTLSGLVAGNYLVRVEDMTTKCDTTLTVQVVDDYVIEEIETITANGVTSCAASDGRLEVTAMTNSAPLGDYTFYWYSENYNTSLSPTNLANTALEVTDPTPRDQDLTGQAAGTYWVVAQHNGTLCYSIPQQRVITDDTPLLDILSETENDPFITCTGIDEGRLKVPAQGSSGTYDFYWYAGQEDVLTATSVPFTTTLAATETEIIDLKGGYYTLIAQDAGGAGPACADTATFFVATQTPTPVLNVSSSDQTICDADGSIRINGISLNNSLIDTTNYDFIWYRSTIDPTGESEFNTNGYTLSAANTYNNLDASTYFIQAVPKSTLPADHGYCATDFVQIIINDETTPLQVVPNFISDPIVACDPNNFGEGEIKIDIDNGSGDYAIRWFRGDQVDNALRIENRTVNGNPVPLGNSPSIGSTTVSDALLIPSLANPGTIEAWDKLPPGTYTVEVVDNVTGCVAVRQYTVQGISVLLTAFPSSLPQTSCIVDNGVIGVAVNGGSGNYEVKWYAGADVTGEVLNPNGRYLLEDLPHGTYTVQVTDTEDAGCLVETKQIVVQDARNNDLEISVAADFPMSNCEDSNPNGQLSAKIKNPQDLFRYEFFWYEGTNTTANPIATGSTVTNLGENNYTVVARDRGTGCLSDPFGGAVVTLLDSGLLPAPTVVMTQPVTRCTDPDGVAQATLDSILTVDPYVDYEYIWYNAQDEIIFSSSRTNEAQQLDTGHYSVVVRNVISGCLSAPGNVYISDSIYVPEFEIVTTPSFCNQPSGTLSINYYEPFQITNIEWQTPYGFANSDFLDRQPAGNYTATITLGNGCQITREAYVVPGIEVYNAVSPNGDQQNDIFTISCIEDFENNIVRIYNRAGSLVYEHQGYDNKIVFFDGYGNQGLYVGGKELPDGTYFYIVDKRNGDEPQSGYLELLR